MAFSTRRFMDILYVVLFICHLLLAFIADFQMIFGKYYPQSFQNLLAWYVKVQKDCLIDGPAWLKAFAWLELVVMVPYFFIAIYAFGKGLKKCPWIRTPTLVFATMLGTILIAISGEILVSDFRGYTSQCPSSMSERLQTFFPYFTIFLFAAMLFIDMTLFAGQAARKTNQPKKPANNPPAKITPAKKNTPAKITPSKKNTPAKKSQ